ncbi:MAG TPA: SDR family NAD(P)-dependent oxidoreductase, partial [Thermoanaerobaculia bacterium]
DPQERLFLEVAWEAVEDAGYYPEILVHEDARRNIGVYVGAVWSMYQVVGVDEQRTGNHVAPNSFLWSIANRVSYWMNLSGPSLTVDTACSSSLTALYLACEALYAGECSAAIVGGVNLDVHQAKWDINQVGGALSPDGVCRTFGKGANGYVAGEGIGALLLKPLDQAVEDGDHVYGVIKSAAVNHGGRTSGYFVPNPAAQGNVIAAALQKADVAPQSIGYIEAHGTGTELGDPIEISGLTNAFSAFQSPDPAEAQSCAVGSIKTNIGHLEAAAGVVSVSKVLLQMQHRQIAPSLHSAELNEFIDFQQSPFYVPQTLQEWTAKDVDGVRQPLRAGISSFGAGGANAHVILESYEPAGHEKDDSATARIFPLSARNEEQLRETAIRLVRFLEQNPIDLGDVAYTLQQGRKSFDQRLAIVATTREELIEKLTCFIDGKKADGMTAGHVKQAEGVTRLLNRREKEEFVRLLAQSRDPQKIAGLWAEGMLADWQGSQSLVTGRRTSLPTYPFAGKRHWVGDRTTARRALQPVSAGVHPMVDSNESTFERQLFRKTFHDGDFFIYDHHVADIPTLPGVAYLELARKAGELAAGRPVRRIQNILWVSPIAVQNATPKEVFIELKPSGEAVQFEVFSQTAEGVKVLHSQGKLLYTPRQDGEPESIDLDAIRARCAKKVDGGSAYPLFRSVGLNLGPSFQVLQEIYKSDSEVLGVLRLPEFRQNDLESMLLHPSLIDGSLQAGMAARLGDSVGEMLVPYSIGEVEILHPLQSLCYSYTTEAKDGKASSRVLKSNVLILDEAGKVLARIRESTGVPLMDVHKSDSDGMSTLYYGYEWEAAPLDDAGRHTPQSILLVGANETLRDSLQARGAQVIPAPAAEMKDDYVRLLEANPAIDSICFTGQNDSPESGVFSFLFLCQAIAQAKLESRIQLVYLYEKSAPHHEAMSGFVKTLQGEYPKLLCQTLEAGHGDAVWSELRGRTNDAVVRYEAQQRYVRKLKGFDLAPATKAELRENGVYLITGGAGGLGLIFAEYLAKQCKARLVLTGRSALSAERQAQLDELRNHGAEVLYVAADVSDVDAVRNLVSEIQSRFGALHGIIHSAGLVRDAYIRNKTAEEMSAVLAPKVRGTLHLDEATRTEALDFFVTFSSLAAVTGNAGQCDYSFANGFMDAFAADRERLRARGERSGKTLSINWSLWADGGMKPDAQTEQLLKTTMGMKPLSAATGLEAFMLGLASDRTQFAVVEGIQAKLDVVLIGKKKTAAPATTDQSATAPVSGQSDDALAAWLQDELSQIVMDFLKLDPSDMSADKILLDLGFDSIGLTSYANTINEKFALDITPILFFDYPSVGEIAKYLAAERKSELACFHGGSASAPAQPQSAQPQSGQQSADSHTIEFAKGWNPAALDRPVTAPSTGGGLSPERRFVDDPIAIVGISGVMPQSDDLDEFWANLRDSKDLVTVVPRDRWRWEDYFGDPLKDPNKTNSKWGGFMREVDKFDPLFFGISPREAQMMDPQQRLFLEHVWKAVEDSGQKVSDLSGTRTGLFLGVGTTDYSGLVIDRNIPLDGYTASGNSHSVTANRVSFLLNLRGPSAPLDTACSSSLVAFHRAVESIHTGSCDMAIVGGVQVMLSPAAYISFSMAGMLSPDGKCKTFDKQANGYVRGEGCGAVFIKRLSAAVADGNHIYAVIKATAENHGGRVTTMTAPNSVAQAELLVDAYEKAHVDPATVGFIECHGTGTGLGDPIEIQALTKAFGELYKRHNKPAPKAPHCGLSSVKTNIGHLETGAGIAGVLKALLAIKHRQIPANLHLQEINPYINLEGTPFFIADKLTQWEAPVGENGAPAPRRAGVSSFGFGGANAHVVLEEYIPANRAVAPANEPQLIVLSAKNDERLKAYVQSMLRFLESGDVELADLAYTLQVGRDEMPERLAIVASTAAELKQKFTAILAGGQPGDTFHGNVKGKTAAEGDVSSLELPRLGELWVAGAKIDWRLLHQSGLPQAGLPRRISAPTYPFARERYWIPEAGTPVVEVEHRLHPLVHRNVSTLQAQKFASRFTGSEFYLDNHRVGPDAVLPAVAYVEMATAAGELAGERKVRVIRDMTWLAPITVGNEAREIELLLTPRNQEIEFEVRSDMTHCRGTLAYAGGQPGTLNVAEIQRRCSSQTISGADLYPFLCTSGLNLGKGFQVVQQVQASESECLAVLRLPEHLKSDATRFSLHPSLLDGALHTAIGMVKQRKPAVSWSVPYAVAEIQIFDSLHDVHYAHATWDLDSIRDDRSLITIQIHLLDRNGNVLVRMRDFVAKPLAAPAAQQEAMTDALQSLVPIWSPVRPQGNELSRSARVLLLGGEPSQLEWLQKSYPDARQSDTIEGV